MTPTELAALDALLSRPFLPNVYELVRLTNLASAALKAAWAERDAMAARLAEAERLLQDIRPVLQTGAWGDMIAAFLARTTPQEK